MARAALAFLGTLDPRRAQQATFSFTQAERLNWHYVPRRREGLPLKDMAADSRTAAHALLQAGLSAAGYAKVQDVMRLEGVLRQLETFGAFNRDPENYAVTIFGKPGQGAPWGWRFEGHHLSLNFTVVPGRAVAVTPAFLGANPAEVPSGSLKGLRVLQAEQDLGLALAGSLDPSQRLQATIAAESLGDIVSGPGREQSLRAPAGVPAGSLGGESRTLVLRLLEAYARNMRGDLAESELRKLHAAGIERVHFAWAGPIDARRPHYYRLHGPTVLIEYDNTQNSANHIHSVWHDPRSNFGADLLGAHYLTDRASRLARRWRGILRAPQESAGPQQDEGQELGDHDPEVGGLHPGLEDQEYLVEQDERRPQRKTHREGGTQPSSGRFPGRPPEQHGREPLPGDDARQEKLARPGRQHSRAGPDERQVARNPPPARREEVEASAEVRQVRERDEGEVEGPEREEPAPEHPEIESTARRPRLRGAFGSLPMGSSSARLYAGRSGAAGRPVAAGARAGLFWTGRRQRADPVGRAT